MGTEMRQLDQVEFMNMCMVCDGSGNILALDKVASSYTGTTFPGGHVELGETFSEAVVREVYEETGLTIKNPVLKGIYHWYRDGVHCVGLLYKADEYEGELKSSEEGKVYWISRKEYEKRELAVGMKRVLKLLENDGLTECFMEIQENGEVAEHLY